MDGMRWLIDFAPGSGKTLSETISVNFDNFLTHAHMIVQ